MTAPDPKAFLADLPLIAILRGLAPKDAVDIIGPLADAGFRVVEIPLNSPEPLKSIETARHAFGDDMLVGAGTVLTTDAVRHVHEAGGQVIVSPNTDRAVIASTKEMGMISIPGAATPSEAFTAAAAGADMVKIFPAEALPPTVVKAWRAVLPAELWLLPVGGIAPDSMASYLDAGANGFGLGSALYRPDYAAADVGMRARAFADAYAALSA